MNTLISDLAAASSDDIMGVKILNQDTFAELIVKECIDVLLADAVHEYWGTAPSKPLVAYAAKIKQHFGLVE